MGEKMYEKSNSGFRSTHDVTEDTYFLSLHFHG